MAGDRHNFVGRQAEFGHSSAGRFTQSVERTFLRQTCGPGPTFKLPADTLRGIRLTLPADRINLIANIGGVEDLL